MPSVNIDLSKVEAFENLPFGSYLGEIAKIQYKEAREAGKFAQIMVTYQVIDGVSITKKQSEWLSLSPKAVYRTKKWFAKFGCGDITLTDESFDPDTDELVDPDLIGVRVIFSVKPDGERVRTELTSVEDDMDGGATPPPPPPARVQQPATPVLAAQPLTSVVDKAAVAKAAKIAAAKAALAALEETEEPELEGEPEPEPVVEPVAVKSRSVTARERVTSGAVAPSTAPVRRTLR